MHVKKILFILKKRLTSGGENSHHTLSSGLFNSIRFVADMLKDYPNSEVKYVEVHDNNCIDREVNLFKPDLVVIEALWVTPDKFDVLHRLHPKVKWVIRLHSDTPFLANEGIAIDWLFRYITKPNVHIAANSIYAVDALSGMLGREVHYLPNYYPVDPTPKKTLNIGCFGAIRPFKNQLTQAIAAVKYADETNRRLYFHINAHRVERGENALKNIRSLFHHTPHVLIEHTWMTHDDFLKIVRRMDMGMQVSMSETFNIVAADFVANEIPIVVSEEITFVDAKYQVTNPKDVSEIVTKMYMAEDWDNTVTDTNKTLLIQHSLYAKDVWFTFLNEMIKKKM